MNDKTAQSMTDELREAAQADLAGIDGWGNLCSNAADTIDNLRAQLAEAQKDAERLDWLGNQFVTVRVPLRYGSKECFMGSPTDKDGEFIPWNIRAAIDAAKGGSNA